VSAPYDELAQLGSATVHEAQGREGVIDLDLIQVIPGSRAAGPARIALCGQGDNLMVHAVMAEAQPGDILVLTMPTPEPVALIGELMVTQAKGRGVAGILVDAAIRDLEELVELGLPIWTHWVRVTGATKDAVGALDIPVEVGGTRIGPGDAVVLDADGAVVVSADRVDEVLEASRARVEKERIKREKLQAGALSYEIDGLREIVEGQ
jgi:4-hydroxy-4-methyl-2-oxoglutarate aldolase